MNTQTLNLRLHTLAIFSEIRKDPVVAALERLLSDTASVTTDEHSRDISAGSERGASNRQEALIERYCAFVAELYKRDTNWSRYLHTLVMEDDNIVVRLAAAGEKLSAPLQESLDRELAILQELSQLTCDEVLQADGVTLPRWEISDCDFAADYQRHLEELPHKGYGIFAKYHTFRVDGGEIVPILSPDPQKLSDLIGYEREREPVIANTRAFLEGITANNVLLYGDAGTGKSSTVKAIVNEYRDRGLRMIEVKKSQLSDIPLILESLADNPLHFILFIDDLSFDSGNEEYIAFKNVLEGGIYDTKGHVLIYATSNRRHFIKEDVAARSGSEMFVGDTIQETMSLAARFGLTVTFQKPKKDLYLQIVEGLAERIGIRMDKEQLITEAEAFAIRASGRSPRTAHQFIDTINIREHIV